MAHNKRYIPHLIQEDYQVLPEYFQNTQNPSSDEQKKWKTVSSVLAITILSLSFCVIAYIPFFIALGGTGLLFFPKVYQSLAKILRFQWTFRARMFSWGFLIVLNLPFAIGFSNVKIYLAERHRALELQQQKDREEAELKEHIRKDSLSISIQRVKDFEENGMIDEALLELNRVDKLTTTYDEISIAQEQRINISLVKVNTLMNGRHYSQAIDLLNNLNALDTSNTETLYQRAICYSKTNHIEEAVRDARLAMIKGNESAGELYEKLNPIRKRVSYYTTLCRDGSYSDATGRGACSHHGGVASWNHPVYEEYRKFE